MTVDPTLREALIDTIETAMPSQMLDYSGLAAIADAILSSGLVVGAGDVRKALENVRQDLASVNGAYATDIHPENREALKANGHQIEWIVDTTGAIAAVDALLPPVAAPAGEEAGDA